MVLEPRGSSFHDDSREEANNGVGRPRLGDQPNNEIGCLKTCLKLMMIKKGGKYRQSECLKKEGEATMHEPSHRGQSNGWKIDLRGELA